MEKERIVFLNALDFATVCLMRKQPLSRLGLRVCSFDVFLLFFFVNCRFSRMDVVVRLHHERDDKMFHEDWKKV